MEAWRYGSMRWTLHHAAEQLPVTGTVNSWMDWQSLRVLDVTINTPSFLKVNTRLCCYTQISYRVALTYMGYMGIYLNPLWTWCAQMWTLRFYTYTYLYRLSFKIGLWSHKRWHLSFSVGLNLDSLASSPRGCGLTLTPRLYLDVLFGAAGDQMFVVVTPFLIRDSHLSPTNLMRQCLMSTVPLQPHLRRGVRVC